MPSAQRSVEIQASPAQVMSVITDFASYPRFLPAMRQVEVLHAGPSSWEVRFTVQVIRSLCYTLQLVREDAHTLRWSLIEGIFRANSGAWILTPLPSGTLASYHIDIQIGMFVPGNIVRSLLEVELPQTLEQFKREAERVALMP